jgi:hypothetical protein
MSEPLLIALIATAGAVIGSVITAAFNAAVNRKNTFFVSLNNAASALNITTEELVETLIMAKQLRGELAKKEAEVEELKNGYKILKGITRKLYRLMQDRNIDPELTEDELKVLFDTQPLMLFREQERTRRKSEQWNSSPPE